MKTVLLDCSILTQIEFFKALKKYRADCVVIIPHAGSYIHQVVIKCALDGSLVETNTDGNNGIIPFTSKIVITCKDVEFFVRSRMIDMNDILISMPNRR